MIDVHIDAHILVTLIRVCHMIVHVLCGGIEHSETPCYIGDRDEIFCFYLTQGDKPGIVERKIP